MPPMSSYSPELFFFQAEDGIRDWSVTGVQTCALPIYNVRSTCSSNSAKHCEARLPSTDSTLILILSSEVLLKFNSQARPLGADSLSDTVNETMGFRSEERRVGKESSERIRRGANTRER